VVASRVTARRAGDRPRAPVTRYLAVSAVLLSTIRFALAIYSGRHELVYGDFAATLPGGYAERLNPTLWNSPDLIHSWAFHEHSYLHGPTQFLTLYPLVFLNSYTEIARLLLAAYAFVMLAAVYVIWRTLRDAEGRPIPAAAVYAAVLAFFPAIQAYAQREFEVVILLATALMFWAVVRDRQGWVGGVLAYIAWFKYLPLSMVPYLVIRRWRRALIGFVLVSGGLLLAAHLLFDLRHFVDNLVPTMAGGQLAVILGRVDFCHGADPKFSAANRTFAGVRWGLCTLQDRGVGIPPLATYLALAGVIAVVGLVGFLRLERLGTRRSPWAERWRRVLELSLLLTIYTTFLFTHYYYLSVLIVPVTALLVRFLADRRWAALAWWSATYACLSTFTFPVGVLDKIFRVNPWDFDAWDWYMRYAVYFPGELLLLALLLHEYVTLPRHLLKPKSG
jgi:hypothetical protein